MDHSKQASRQGTGNSKRRTPVETTPSPTPAAEGASLISGAMGFWKAANRRLRDLEDKLVNQVSITLP